MPITKLFLDKLRDVHNVDETKVRLGTDNTPASINDTALGNEVGDFEPISSFEGNTGEITKVYQVNADELIGENLQEIGFTTKEVLQSRNIITAISKSANEVIQIVHKTTYVEGV